MGCSDSYETKVQPVKNTENLNKPKPIHYNIQFKIPTVKFGFDPGFIMDIKDCVIKEFPFGNYTGQIKDGERNGKGCFIWTKEDSKGHVYEGDWKNDKMHGKGMYSFGNYKSYNGDWFEGDMHGKGIMRYTDGYYEGDWVHDNREGKGKFLWTVAPKRGDIYEGEWKNDERNGKGVYKKANGDTYEGEWKDDVLVDWIFVEKGEPNPDFKQEDNYVSNTVKRNYNSNNSNRKKETEQKKKGGDFRNKYGNILGRIDDNGVVKDSCGSTIGYIRDNGQIADSYGSTIGYIRDNGEVANNYGSIIGFIRSNGDVTNNAGATIGYVRNNGEVANAYGASLGNVGSMDNKAAAAAMFFFFFKDEI